jgi:DNA-binding PadR family transcriptional regulator
MKRRKVNNLLALALLGLLAPGRPMHPYEMATLLRRTGKERDMNIKWGSFYTVVQNMEKHGLIEATGVDRDGRRPERTTYVITDAGREELADWLRELVATPDTESLPFQAALSVVGALEPDEVETLLRARVTALDADIAQQRQELARSAAAVPRLFLVEAEYALAMREAELTWVRALLSELAAGTLPGYEAWRDYHRLGLVPPEFADLLADHSRRS